MMIVRDQKTGHIRVAAPADIPIAELTALGVFNQSIVAEDKLPSGEPAWDWITSGRDADGFASEEVVEGKEWKVLPDYVWRARACDNDSFGHTTVHRWVAFTYLQP
jgi:hypothetical protein